MPLPTARRWLLIAPILLYVVALLALRMHLPTGEPASLVVAVLAGGLAIAAGVALVRRHRISPGRLSSRG